MIIHSRIKDYRLEVVEDIWSSKFLSFPNASVGNPDKAVAGPPIKTFGGDNVGIGSQINRPFYLIDSNVLKLYGPQLRRLISDDFVLAIDADERNKEYMKVADYYRALIEAGFTRNDTLVTFGGGILQDISGFIASTLYRGTKWVYVPTTLLAQADSCIGSKTSVNFGPAKNLIGTFYPPDVICSDLSFTRTLSPADFNSGLGEIIKFHLLSDANGYALLRRYLDSGDLRGPLFRDIILSTLSIKRSYFEGDEFDTGRRNLLNYGHCYGHALESASDFAIAHGEAVMVGMGFANDVSLKRGILSKQRHAEIEALLRRFYPKFDLGGISAGRVIEYLKRDKKRTGAGLTMVLARDIGQCEKFDDVNEDEVRAAHEGFARRYGR